MTVIAVSDRNPLSGYAKANLHSLVLENRRLPIRLFRRSFAPRLPVACSCFGFVQKHGQRFSKRTISVIQQSLTRQSASSPSHHQASAPAKIISLQLIRRRDSPIELRNSWEETGAAMLNPNWLWRGVIFDATKKSRDQDICMGSRNCRDVAPLMASRSCHHVIASLYDEDSEVSFLRGFGLDS